MTSSRMRYKKAGSERPASSGLNSMSSQPLLLRYLTALTAFETTCSMTPRSRESFASSQWCDYLLSDAIVEDYLGDDSLKVSQLVRAESHVIKFAASN